MFALAAGLDEYLIVSDGVHVRDARGEWRPIENKEIYKRTVKSMGNSIPYAIVSIAILFGVSRICFSWLHRLSGKLATFIGLIIGAACGSLLSIAVWIMLGGWGPPYLHPAMAAGSIVTALVSGAVPRKHRNLSAS